MKDLKVIFMGTPVFCVPILEELIKETNVLAVVTQPDKEVGRKHEISFSPIKKVAIKNNIKVSIPYIVDKYKMKLKYIKDYDKDINRNTKFGNGEPFDYCKNASIKEISMFIIPALAFDEYCNRLGFGKGYYHNILKLNKKALRIGLAYDYQILPNLPKDNNDEMLDIIISENKVIKAD